VGSVFFCRCCQVEGHSWNVRRQFTRLPPTSPLHERPRLNFRAPVIRI
jgi:hypothetical protein